MNKIIVIGNIEGEGGLKNRMDKNLYFFYVYLKNHSKFTIELFDSSEKQLLINNNNPKNIVIVLPGCKLEYIEELQGSKVYEMMDVTCRCRKYGCIGGPNSGCRSNELLGYLKKHNVYSYLFFHYYTYIVREQFRFIPNRFYFPHFIDNNINRDYGLKKEYDILFFGNTWAKFYPFRYRLKTLLEKNRGRWNIFFVDYENPLVGTELSKKINESWLTICTKSYNNLFFQKYMEISMCKSVICGDFPDLEEKVFGENMVYLDMSMKDNQILNTIQEALDNKDKLIKMSEETYKIAMEKYTYEKGLEIFEKYIDDIIVNENL